MEKQNKYLAYPAYKDSGVEWLGEVPGHWEIRRLKFSVDLISAKVNARESDLQFIGLENIASFTGKLITADSKLESDGVALFHSANDVLFCKLRPYLAKVYLAQDSGLCTSELLVLRGIDVIPSFLKYHLLSQEFINVVDSSTYGSKMPRANWEFIGNLACLIPSLDEQQQIAYFLDDKTAHLDKLIGQKQQMIGLLNEKRMALITQAVTKGLDLTVPMKDSGVEWLGDVPEHWEIRRLKFSVDLISSKVNAKDSELQFIGLENIESFTGKIITADSKLESDGVALCYQADDVLFCKLRPYLAKVYLSTQAGLCTSELLVLRGIEVIPVFLKYYLLSQEFINIVDSSTYGSKMPRANWDFTGNLQCLIPHEREQQQIAQYLDTETQKIDAMIKTVKQAITTLQEYRTALITAAVTGKIDVRGLTSANHPEG